MNKLFRLFAAWVVCASLASAQPRHDTDFAPLKPLPAEEAKTHLEGFRHTWFGSDVGLSFTLVHRPRRGDDVTFTGMAWSSWVNGGPVTRVQLLKPAADKTAKSEVWQWVLQSGQSPHVWVLAPGATAAVEVPPAKWREPFIAGLIYTPFDLMLPFLYWPEKYDGTDRISDRGVDVYTMNPPSAEKDAGLLPVKISLDRELGEFGTLVRTQALDAKGKVALEFNLDKVAKVQEHWIVKSCRLIDQVKGDYDQFTVKSAAVPSEKVPFKLDPAIFTPTGLSQPVPPLPAAAWSNL